MRQPKKWYRLALFGMFCTTLIICVKVKAIPEAFNALLVVGAVALGASVAKLWPKK